MCVSREVELLVKAIFYRYIYEVLAEKAIKFLSMERESCDKDIPMGKALREEKALNTVYFEKIEWAASKIKTSICGI